MKIFVQIPAYRDSQLIPTIKDLLATAKNPKDLVVAICNQYSPEDKFGSLSIYKKDRRFRIVNILYTEAKGVGFAMYNIQKLYENEEYCLKIDSHMRFVQNWDEEMIMMIQSLQEKGYPKPILTGYPPSFDPKNDPEERQQVPFEMHFEKFTKEGLLLPCSQPIVNWESRKDPVRARFLSGGFCFTLGQFVKEVPYNPEYYFHGEEISLAVRSFTHGYDLFHSHKILLWHEYTRKESSRQWDNDKNWFVKNDNSHLINRRLFKIEGRYSGKYGFGKERTLEDYERYAGIIFKRKMVQQHTLDRKSPPNPLFWEEYENVDEEVPVLLSEMVLPTVSVFSRVFTIQNIQCDTNAACGSKCWFCPVRYNKRPSPQIMTPEFFELVLSQIDEGIKIQLIDPNFGLWLCAYNDILIDPYLKTRLESIRKHSFRFSLITNAIGLFKNAELIHEYRDIIAGYSINLPAGNSEDYEKYTMNTKKTFDRIVKGIKKLYSLDPVYYDGRIQIGINGISDEIKAREQANYAIPLGDLKKQEMQLKKIFPFCGITANGVLSDRAGMLKNVIDNTKYWKIPSEISSCENLGDRLTTWLHISSSGKVFSCCQDYDEKYQYGDLNSQNIAEIAYSKVRESVSQETRKELCTKCIYAKCDKII